MKGHRGPYHSHSLFFLILKCFEADKCDTSLFMENTTSYHGMPPLKSFKLLKVCNYKFDLCCSPFLNLLLLLPFPLYVQNFSTNFSLLCPWWLFACWTSCPGRWGGPGSQCHLTQTFGWITFQQCLRKQKQKRHSSLSDTQYTDWLIDKLNKIKIGMHVLYSLHRVFILLVLGSREYFNLVMKNVYSEIEKTLLLLIKKKKGQSQGFLAIQ